MTYKSILCLNGDLPGKDFFTMLKLPIVAADGAANKLHMMGIKPSIVIGDLDSIDLQLDMNFLHIEDQSRCDYEKSMEFLEGQGLLPTIVLGTSGGDLDHILNNINLFTLYSPGNLIFADPLYGTVLKEPLTHITLPINTKVSLIGLPHARLVTEGLQWDLNDSILSFPGNTSCFNRTTENKIKIQVSEGNLLFLAHDFFLQDSRI